MPANCSLLVTITVVILSNSICPSCTHVVLDSHLPLHLEGVCLSYPAVALSIQYVIDELLAAQCRNQRRQYLHVFSHSLCNI